MFYKDAVITDKFRVGDKVAITGVVESIRKGDFIQDEGEITIRLNIGRFGVRIPYSGVDALKRGTYEKMGVEGRILLSEFMNRGPGPGLIVYESWWRRFRSRFADWLYDIYLKIIPKA